MTCGRQDQIGISWTEQHRLTAELDQVVERLGEVICVPPDHHGPCLTPWTLMRSAVDDLDERERSEKRGLLKDQ